MWGERVTQSSDPGKRARRRSVLYAKRPRFALFDPVGSPGKPGRFSVRQTLGLSPGIEEQSGTLRILR
jgi:hypothetical protein